MPPVPPAPERILIIRPSALGDVCRSVPVLASLRGAYPKARIDWLVQDGFADAVTHHPMLTVSGGGVVPFPRKAVGLGRLWTSEGREKLDRLLQSLKTPRYDLVYDFQGLGRSGFFAWWTGAPHRVGYRNARELGWLGVNRRHHVPTDRHAVDRMLDLLDAQGVMPVHDLRLYANPHDAASLDSRLRGASYAVIAPTSRWPGKRWPAERFAALIEALLATRRIDTVVVVASASERDQCGPILNLAKREPRILDQIGRTTVGELMAIIQQSRLVVANDSAALHMAVGFDRPMVGLFGPTRVELVGPYRRNADVVQAERPRSGTSHKNDREGGRMMEKIALETVIQACEARLGP